MNMRCMLRAVSGCITCLGILAVTSRAPGGGFEPIAETGANLKGTVKFKGEPVRVGIVIVGTGAGQVNGDIMSDGTYAVYNVSVGEANVAVNMGPATGQIITLQQLKASGQNVEIPKVPCIPANYQNADSTPLKVTIKPGENTFDIAID